MENTNTQPNGLLLINKPSGITSFDIIRTLRRQTGVRKIGHAGTLDPMATGLMLMLFGSACKKAAQFSGLDKTYVAEMTLGSNSTTGDAEGVIDSVSDKVPSGDEVKAALEQFEGEITQTPPQYSAIKINGQEAYKLARKGVKVDMPSRQVAVRSIKLLDYSYPMAKFEANVSSGTYIRTLAEDIGGILHTGAYLSALRRTKVGEFSIGQADVLSAVNSTNLMDELLTV